MIVVDTSALMAIASDEPFAGLCLLALEREPHALISAGTLAEAMIVATGRNILDDMVRVVRDAELDIVPVTAVSAHRIGSIYARWGKGLHPAGLNFGDCFAYELATQKDCPLLFIGDDFAQTDVKRALSSAAYP